MYDYDKAIRKVPDFPKKGIVFYDITSLLTNVEAMKHIKNDMLTLYSDKSITKIIAIESRGFLLAPLLADALNLPIVLARKKGKLPNETYREDYQLEYGTDTVEIQKLDIDDKDNFLIVEDLIATGGMIRAVASVIEKNSKARVAYVFAVIGLPFLKYEDILKGLKVSTLINYDSE